MTNVYNLINVHLKMSSYLHFIQKGYVLYFVYLKFTSSFFNLFF